MNDRACKDCGDKVYDFQTGERCSKCQTVHSVRVSAEARLAAAKSEREALEISKQNRVVIHKKLKKRIALIWLALWVTMGAGYAMFQRHSGSKGCVYRSIASIANPGFVLGCELFRERWEIGK